MSATHIINTQYKYSVNMQLNEKSEKYLEY